MAALNIFLDGDSKISKDAKSEFSHNLLMQALSKSDNSVLIKFDSVSLLAKNINEIFQNKVFELKKENLKIQEKLNEEIYEKNLNTSKIDIKLIEGSITGSIENDIKIDYPNEDNFPMSQTAEKIDKDRIKEEIEYLQTGITMWSRNFETIQNIEDKRNELIKSITNPLEY